MIHVRGLDELPLLQAFLAIGMLQDEASAKCLPSPTIATLRGCSSRLAPTGITCSLRLGLEFRIALGACLGMSFAIALASGDRRVASRIGAECEKGHGSEEEKDGDPSDRRRTRGHRRS